MVLPRKIISSYDERRFGQVSHPFGRSKAHAGIYPKGWDLLDQDTQTPLSTAFLRCVVLSELVFSMKAPEKIAFETGTYLATDDVLDKKLLTIESTSGLGWMERATVSRLTC